MLHYVKMWGIEDLWKEKKEIHNVHDKETI